MREIIVRSPSTLVGLRWPAGATVGDLADRLGDRTGGLVIDGVRQAPAVPLEACVVHGARIDRAGPHDRGGARAELELRVVAGPDAGARLPLPVGSTVVCGPGGRPGPVIRDVSLAAFAAVVEVGDGGDVVCVPLGDATARPCSLPPGVPLQLGRSVVAVVPTARQRSVIAVRAVEGRIVHQRPPRRMPRAWSPPSVALADDAPVVAATPTSLPLTALIGAAVTAVLAVALGQPMLALFGASGAVVACVGWLIERRRARAGERDRVQRDRASLSAAMAAQGERRASLEMHRRRTVVDLAEALDWIDSRDVRLWERRSHHPDAATVVVGVGEHAWSACDGAAPSEVLRGVPVTVTLAPATMIGIVGDRERARAVARSWLVQLAAQMGPADLAFGVLADEPTAWRWIDWLPHTAGACRVVVVDGAMLQTDPGDVVVVLADDAADLPARCTAALVLGSRRDGWHGDLAHGLPTPVIAAGLAADRAEDAAARLAALVDPEAPETDVVPLAALVPGDQVEIRRRWVEGQEGPPCTVLGTTADGPLEIDLVRDGPHALVAGTTGAGKSELLRTLVVGLAAQSPPDALSFLLVDYKGGAAFDACTRLPHVVGVVDDLDTASAARALRSLHAEIRRRETLLREHGVADVAALPRGCLARLVVVVDEFATLAADLPDFVPALVSVAQRGRSLGIHLVLATQRPGGAVTDDIRANTNLRIALRVTAPAEAMDVVADRSPADFPRDRPGLAAVRRGSDDLVVVQVASTAHGRAAPPQVVECRSVGSSAVERPVPTGSTLDRWVDEIGAAALGRPAPHRPWLDPLPAVLHRPDLLEPGDIGVLDDPDHQCRRPLRWEPGDGPLLIVGSSGAGVVAAAVADSLTEATGATLVIETTRDPAWQSALARGAVADVVPHGDVERLARAVVIAAQRPSLGLVVDGLTTVRSVLADVDTDLADTFDRILGERSALVVTASDASRVPAALSARCERRWVVRIADPLDALALGLSVAEVPGADAPPGRVVAVPERLAGQVVTEHRVGTGTTSVGAVVSALPTVVAGECVPAARVDGGDVVVALGLGWHTAEWVTWRWRAAAHVLVAGPPGTGRTTALAGLASHWASLGRGVVWLPGRAGADASPVAGVVVVADAAQAAARAVGDDVLLVVDDADRVDDPTGALERLVSSGVVRCAIGGRADTLRSFGHWAAPVRRDRTGLVLAPSGLTDGDIVGAVLPRRRAVPDAPGRGWWVVDGQPIDLVQVPLVGLDVSRRTGGQTEPPRSA